MSELVSPYSPFTTTPSSHSLQVRSCDAERSGWVGGWVTNAEGEGFGAARLATGSVSPGSCSMTPARRRPPLPCSPHTAPHLEHPLPQQRLQAILIHRKRPRLQLGTIAACRSRQRGTSKRAAKQAGQAAAAAAVQVQPALLAARRTCVHLWQADERGAHRLDVATQQVCVGLCPLPAHGHVAGHKGALDAAVKEDVVLVLAARRGGGRRMCGRGRRRSAVGRAAAAGRGGTASAWMDAQRWWAGGAAACRTSCSTFATPTMHATRSATVSARRWQRRVRTRAASAPPATSA